MWYFHVIVLQRMARTSSQVRAALIARLLSSDQANSQLALSLPFPSLMLKLPNRELKQPRRLRLIKRHLKVNICAKVTILRLLLFTRIVSLTNYAKNGPGGAS